MMENKKQDKILILSATFGEGHNKVAEAIGEAIEHSIANVKPVTMDVMDTIHPYLYPISHYIYIKTIKQFPHFYRLLYRKTKDRNYISTKFDSLFSVGKSSILEVIEQVQPLVVVCTYPFAARIISKLKEQGLLNIPAVTVITEFTDHSYWIYPFTDQYVVGSRQVLNSLILQGIDEKKVKYTGIPVRQSFTKSHAKVDLGEKYHTDLDKFSILMMGGGDGFIGKGLSTFKALESLTNSIQLIIVCGRNRKLKSRLKAELKDSKHEVLLFGYYEYIDELMAVSDLIITKSGGVTTSEAIAMGLPLLIYNPLPGQEEDNANFLVKLGLARLVDSDKSLINYIERLSHDTYSLALMRQKNKQYQPKDSSIEAVKSIYKIVK